MKKSKIMAFLMLFLLIIVQESMATSYDSVENYIESCTDSLESLYEMYGSLSTSQENMLKNDINDFIQQANDNLAKQEDKYGEDSSKFTTKDIKAIYDTIYQKWTNTGKKETVSSTNTEKKKINIKNGASTGKIQVYGEEGQSATMTKPNQTSYGVAGGAINTIETAFTNGILSQSGNNFIYMVNGTKLCNGYVRLDIDLNGVPEYYYFDNNGYLLVNGKTPDSYKTNEIGQCIDSFGIKIGESNPNAKIIESKVLTKTMTDLPSSITNLISSSKEPLDRAFFRGKLRELEWDPAEVENLIENVDWKKEAVKFLEKLYSKHDDYDEKKIREKMTNVEFTKSEINHAFWQVEKPSSKNEEYDADDDWDDDDWDDDDY